MPEDVAARERGHVGMPGEGVAQGRDDDIAEVIIPDGRGELFEGVAGGSHGWRVLLSHLIMGCGLVRKYLPFSRTSLMSFWGTISKCSEKNLNDSSKPCFCSSNTRSTSIAFKCLFSSSNCAFRLRSWLISDCVFRLGVFIVIIVMLHLMLRAVGK